MATQMSAYPSFASRLATGIRVIVCEPDAAVREQLRSFIESDPVLTLAAESRDWNSCGADLDDHVPELLIARAELIPPDWAAQNRLESFPVVIALRTDYAGATTSQRNDLALPTQADAIQRALNQAVRDIYDRKAKQLLYLVDRYVAGSSAISGYRTAIRVERGGELFDLHVGKIMSIVAARKCVSIHSMNGNFMLREPIHLLATRLDPATFIRIHRSVIINRHHLDSSVPIPAKPSHIVLVDGSRYPVGPNYRDALEETIKPISVV